MGYPIGFGLTDGLGQRGDGGLIETGIGLVRIESDQDGIELAFEFLDRLLPLASGAWLWP